MQSTNDTPWINTLTPEDINYNGASDGVAVQAVGHNSRAARAGLKVGDVITAINGQPVTTRHGFASLLREFEHELKIEIVRDNQVIVVSAASQ